MRCFIVIFMLLISQFATAQVVLEALEGFTPNARCLELIRDKHYGDGLHNFIYCAVEGPNGKKWLNLNLGAEYAKESSPHFNPEAQPTHAFDWKASGSLFQYGRGADGHELVTYSQGQSGYWEIQRHFPIRNIPLTAGETSNQVVSVVGNDFYRTSDYNFDVFYQNNKNNWIGDHPSNPCPTGYRVVNSLDLDGLTAWYGGDPPRERVALQLNSNLLLYLSPSIVFQDNVTSLAHNNTPPHSSDTNSFDFAGMWLWNNPIGRHLVIEFDSASTDIYSLGGVTNRNIMLITNTFDPMPPFGYDHQYWESEYTTYMDHDLNFWKKSTYSAPVRCVEN